MKTFSTLDGSKDYLLPGEAVVRDVPGMVSTVLGSCVAVVLYHPRKHVGGLFHSIFPHCARFSECNTPCADRFRYTDCATRSLLRMFLEMEDRPELLVVKLFGGADSFGGPANGQKLSVGAENIRSAMAILRAAGHLPSAMDVGGPTGRKMIFHPHTGDVFIKRLSRDTARGRSFHLEPVVEPAAPRIAGSGIF